MAVARFGALANPQRIRIVRLLLAAFQIGGMTAGQIRHELGIPGSTLTHHLARLETTGLIESRRDRRWIWYSASLPGLQAMLSFLYENCCSRAERTEPNDPNDPNDPKETEEHDAGNRNQRPGAEGVR